MTWGDWLPIIVAVVAAAPGLIALWQNRKKNEAETGKVKAETEKVEAETKNLHAQAADRWMEHVDELMLRVKALEETAKQDAVINKNLETQIESLSRIVEAYRQENADLKDWAERLVAQFKKHLPKVEPEAFIRRKVTGELHAN